MGAQISGDIASGFLRQGLRRRSLGNGCDCSHIRKAPLHFAVSGFPCLLAAATHIVIVGDGTDIKGQRPAVFFRQCLKTGHRGSCHPLRNDLEQRHHAARAGTLGVRECNGRRLQASSKRSVSGTCGAVAGSTLRGVKRTATLKIGT